MLSARPTAGLRSITRPQRALTEPASSSTVAPRSRWQRHRRKRLEKHGQGCAAGSLPCRWGARIQSQQMTWRDKIIVAAISALLAAAITVAVRIVIENLTF